MVGHNLCSNSSPATRVWAPSHLTAYESGAGSPDLARCRAARSRAPFCSQASPAIRVWAPSHLTACESGAGSPDLAPPHAMPHCTQACHWHCHAPSQWHLRHLCVRAQQTPDDDAGAQWQPHEQRTPKECELPPGGARGGPKRGTKAAPRRLLHSVRGALSQRFVQWHALGAHAPVVLGMCRWIQLWSNRSQAIPSWVNGGCTTQPN